MQRDFSHSCLSNLRNPDAKAVTASQNRLRLGGAAIQEPSQRPIQKMHERSTRAAMTIKAYTVGICAFVIALNAIAVPPASSQTTTRRYYYVTANGTRDAVGRPRARIVVVPRSFLDAGTEVLPGERKFTDYAFPPTHTPLDVVTNVGGRVGWHRSPLPGPFDLPGRNNPYGWEQA